MDEHRAGCIEIQESYNVLVSEEIVQSLSIYPPIASYTSMSASNAKLPDFANMKESCDTCFLSIRNWFITK